MGEVIFGVKKAALVFQSCRGLENGQWHNTHVSRAAIGRLHEADSGRLIISVLLSFHSCLCQYSRG